MAVNFNSSLVILSKPNIITHAGDSSSSSYYYFYYYYYYYQGLEGPKTSCMMVEAQRGRVSPPSESHLTSTTEVVLRFVVLLLATPLSVNGGS